VEVRVLGALEVVDDQGRPFPLRGERVRSLVGALALAEGLVVPASRLIADLWGEHPPRGAANALQALVSKLRRIVGPDAVVTEPPGYALAVRADAIDAHRFERLTAAGRAALTAGEVESAAALLAEALTLWRGPALVDVVDTSNMTAAATRLEELRAAAVEDRFDAELALGRHAELVAEVEAAVAAAPFRERRRWQLMLALYRAGRQTEALRAYHDARSLLAGELGLEPSPELRRLEAAILAHDPSLELSAPSPPETPTAVAHAVAHDAPTNLRPALNRFVGRADDLHAVTELLAVHRLVALVGTGGSGKTRLALEVARRVAGLFPNGVWFVALDAVGSGSDAIGAITAAIGLAAGDTSGQRPLPAGARAERLGAFLADREALLVLDNCEHVIEDAAAVAEDLLGAARRLRVLATSRERLRVPGEMLWSVRPLTPADSVELFAERARAAATTFELTETTEPFVAELCQRLDGMPLAIELAAARVRAFPVEQLLERLDDRFGLLTGGARTALPRQQTLRAVVDWSYDLLFEDERRIFERLSVFTGGCTLEAAEAVCADDDVPDVAVADIVARLVDKSLVVAEDARYRVLFTLGHYGRERLVARDELAAVHDRHAARFTQMAEEWDRLASRDQLAWKASIDGEIDNIRAALRWCTHRGDAETAQRLATPLRWYWLIVGLADEGLRWLEAALACPGDSSAVVRARAQTAASWLAGYVGDVTVATRRANQAVELARSIGDDTALSTACGVLARMHLARGDHAAAALWSREAELAFRARQQQVGAGPALMAAAGAAYARGDVAASEAHAEAAVDAMLERDDLWGSLVALDLLRDLLTTTGRYDVAATAVERARTVSEEAGLPGYQCLQTARLAGLALALGDVERADELHESAFRQARELALPTAEALTLNGMGTAARRRRHLDDARSCHERALALYDRLGAGPEVAYSACCLGFVAQDAGDLSEAGRQHTRALGLARSLADPGATALALEGLAAAIAADDPRRAARLLGGAQALRSGARAAIPPTHRDDIERAHRIACTQLGDERFDAELAAGANQSVDALVPGLASPNRDTEPAPPVPPPASRTNVPTQR
jgi:predicted ATPase/DNA-binding SARP family transcriptional activator